MLQIHLYTHNTERGNKQTVIEKDIWFVEDGRSDENEKHFESKQARGS